MSDVTLERIKLAQQGDASALALLLREHYSFLYKYLIKVTMDPLLAEELAGILWSDAWRRLEATMVPLLFLMADHDRYPSLYRPEAEMET